METFVLRLFRPDPDSDQELHGHVEHVASGVTVTFHTTAEMVSNITRLTHATAAKPVATPSTEPV